jgi:hypothetical protein
MRGPDWSDFETRVGPRFRRDRDLGAWMDERRNHSIDLMNELLGEIGHPPLQRIQGW